LARTAIVLDTLDKHQNDAAFLTRSTED